MATLSGTTPQATYGSLIKFNNNSPISATLRALSDGGGGATPVLLSSTQINIGGAGTVNATLGAKGIGNTAGTVNFRTESANGLSYLQVDDLGQIGWSTNSGAGGGQLNALGIRTYEFNSPGGWGSSKLKMDGVCDLYSNDGVLALRLNANFTGVADPTAIGQITAPNSNSMLELVSTTRGFLPPRMTTAQVNAIVTPTAGLIVYNTTLNLICFHNGTSWLRIPTTTAM